MRAALLPTPGDPFMLAYWLRNFETWRGEVDELVVYINGAHPADLERDKRLVVDAGGRWISSPLRVGHDGAILRLLEFTEATHVVLCEDDAYVRTPGSVRAAFDRIGSGQTDIVGSPRHEDYLSSPLQEWGPYNPGAFAELRHGLWPAFLFARRDDLLATDRVFSDRAWWIGEEVEGWGHVTRAACDFVGIATDYIHLDTLFGTTFQLRAMGLRTELVHHVRLFDAPAVEQWIADDPPWFHVTGLSTLDYILDGRGDIPDRGLWERRIAWWMEAGVFATRDRLDRLDAFVARAGIDLTEVERWSERFEAWTAKVAA